MNDTAIEREPERMPDVMRELSKRLPHRFKLQEGIWFASLVVTFGGVEYAGSIGWGAHHALVQAACQEECAARGWMMVVSAGSDQRYKPPTYNAAVYFPDGSDADRDDERNGADEHSPGLAAATALCEALIADESKVNTQSIS